MTSVIYNPTNPERVNPEFIGIAQKYSHHKRNRQSLEQQRNSLMRNLKYKISIDRTLENSLEEKQEKLLVVRGVHARHQGELEEKREKEARRRRQLNELNRTVQATRTEQRKNVREAVIGTQSRNRKQREMHEKMLESLRSEMQSTKMSRLEEKRTKFREIKLGEREGQQTVNSYYRQKNVQSLNTYKSLIETEAETANKYKEDIEIIENTISKYDRRIDKKRRNLCEVLDQISLYTLEPAEQQSKCLPLYLRNTASSSISRHSSRPTDILLKGPRSIIDNEESLNFGEKEKR